MCIENAIYKLKFCVASQAGSFDDCKLTKDGNCFRCYYEKLGIKKKVTNDMDVFNGMYYYQSGALNRLAMMMFLIMTLFQMVILVILCFLLQM